MSISSPIHGQSEHNSSIFDLAPLPMWIYDLKTFQFLAVNHEAIRHYGYSEKQFLNMTIKDIRPAEDIPAVEKAVEEARTRSELYKQSLFRHQKKDGSIIYVQIKSNLITYKGKHAEIVSAVDLTDRYGQEKHIEKQKKLLSIIGDINQLLLKSDNWSTALDSCFQMVGKALDVDRMYFFQNNVKAHTTSQRLEWVRDTIQSQLDNPELQNIPYAQFPLFLKPLLKGEPFKAVVSALPPSATKEILTQQEIRSILVLPVLVSNTFSGFIGLDDCKNERVWQDDEFQLLYTLSSNLGHVIRESQAHQKLLESKTRLKSLVQNGTDLIAIVDINGNYKYVAPTSTKVLGIAPKDFIGKNAFDFIYKEDADRVKKKLEDILEKDHVSIEPYRFPDAKGNLRWVQTELSNHLNNPSIAGIVANTREVTAEMAKRISDELVASLTRAIGHPGSLSACITVALKKLLKLSNICVSEMWLVSEDNARLDLISKVYQEKSFNALYYNSKSVDTFEINVGLPGNVWKTQKPLVWQNLSSNKQFIRAAAAKVANLNTAIGLPIIYNKEFIGCLVCFSPSKKEQLSDQIKLLTEVSQQLGAVIKQKVTEEEYRTFFDISPDPHCIVGFDGYIKKFNKAFIKLLGYEKQDLLSNPIFHFIHETDRVKGKERLEESIKGDSSKSFEARFLTKNKDVRWLIWNGAVIPEAKVIITAAKDITEQKTAEQELSAAYERLRAAQKIAKLGYWVRRFDAEVSEWSEETYKIYGYTSDNFIPTLENITRTFHPDDRYMIESNPVDHLTPGQVQSFEHRILTASGEVKWVRQEIRLSTDDHGIPVQIEGTTQDITERKEHEEQLSLSNERFKLAMEASNEMIWEIDHLNQRITRGKGYEETFNYDQSEPFINDNSWFDKLHPDDLERVWDSLQNTFQDKDKEFWETEYRVLSSNGSISYFVDRCYILRNKNGKPIRSIGSALDVTASRLQLEHIKKQNNNLREIAWLQSHVIRAPLSRIMSLIYLSNEMHGGGKSKEEILSMISDSANELDAVIRDITDKTNAIKDEDAGNFTN